jgi:hypothetical protein
VHLAFLSRTMEDLCADNSGVWGIVGELSRLGATGCVSPSVATKITRHGVSAHNSSSAAGNLLHAEGRRSANCGRSNKSMPRRLAVTR